VNFPFSRSVSAPLSEMDLLRSESFLPKSRGYKWRDGQSEDGQSRGNSVSLDFEDAGQVRSRLSARRCSLPESRGYKWRGDSQDQDGRPESNGEDFVGEFDLKASSPTAPKPKKMPPSPRRPKDKSPPPRVDEGAPQEEVNDESPASEVRP